MKAKLIELFASIQGEGLWVGKPQVFVRFHGCRLKCTYCDTPLTHHSIKNCRIEYPPFSKKFTQHPLEFSAQELDAAIDQFKIKSLALTGGEPLEQSAFIHHWLSQNKGRYEVLLETNGIEVAGLDAVLDSIQMISMDVKLPSSSKEVPYWDQHESFLNKAKGTPTYVKIVYDESITDSEIQSLEKMIKTHLEVKSFVFQPVSPLQKRDLGRCLALFWQFAQKFPERVRLIPQTHKFINIL